MKLLISLVFGILVLGPVRSQTIHVGHRQFTFKDASRNDRPVLTEIYYPSDMEGDNVPVSGQPGDAYPVLVFGHGFVMEWSAYANIWTKLVPQGYFIAFPRTETGISPDHETFARDLAFVIQALREEGNTATSPFFGRVDSTSCVMGHSMGGGSSILAAQYSVNITAMVNFAAAETNPSAIAACPAIHLPSLVFAGGNDCITPPETNQVLMYDSLASDCKTLVWITGASHCQFAEQNVLCSFGELTCSPAPAISRDEQHRIVDTLLIPWLDYHLKGSCIASVQFQSILDSAVGWTYSQICQPCMPVSTETMETPALFEVFPVPSSGNFYLRSTSAYTNADVRVFNLRGQEVYQQIVEGDKDGIWQSNTELNPGIYYLQVTYADKKEIHKLIIL